MKKKIMSVIVLGFAICVMLSGCSLEKMTEPKMDYKVENGEAILTKVPNKSTITEIVIPDEYEGVPVTEIKDFSATNLENVEKISIGKNVKAIGSWAFENNQKLKEFEVSEENLYYCDVDGVLFTKDMKKILFYPASKDLVIDGGEEGMLSSYEIPNGVEIVGTKAFYKCQKIKSVTIPNTVRDIEEKAFFRCSAMENVVLPNGLEHIGKDTFSYCVKFDNITIPATVNSIDTYAFYNCKKLLDIDILAKEDEIKLEEKWYPTDNGKKIAELDISYQ